MKTQEYWQNFINEQIALSQPVIQIGTLQELIDEGELTTGAYRHKERTWKDLTDPEKISVCTHQSGKYSLGKLISGKVQRQPIYCNLCDSCYQANALKLQDKVEMIAKYAKDTLPDGKWRKKTADDGKEAKSLKKHVSRNQDGRHFEVACDESTNDVYTYVVDEPGKNMDEIYGEPVHLEEIDYQAMYEKNRSTGKKLSVGKAFKTNSPSKKNNSVRVAIPQIIVHDVTQQDEAEKIIHRTNYLHLAKDAEDVKRLYGFQLKLIIRHLEAACVKIAAIKSKYYYIDKDQALSEWNRNVKYWMSINASSPLDEEANVDNITKYLVQRIDGKPEKLIN